MTPRIGAARVAVTRPVSALISAVLLLLTTVAGVGGVGGFAALGKAPSRAGSTVAAASTIAVPVAGERRAALGLGIAGGHQRMAGWAPHHPDSADVPAAGWQPPAGLADATVEAGPAVLALTVQVAHRGRAPPAGSLST
jgi:hypothetical protein